MSIKKIENDLLCALRNEDSAKSLLNDCKNKIIYHHNVLRGLEKTFKVRKNVFEQAEKRRGELQNNYNELYSNIFSIMKITQ